MATPNNFLNRYTAFPYGLPFGQWPLAGQQLLAFHPNSRLPPLPQHFSYNYMHPNPYFALAPLPPHTLPLAAPAPHPLPHSAPLLPGPTTAKPQNKNQKTAKTPNAAEVIEISDDDEHLQQEKPCEEKSASSTAKNTAEECPINTTLINQLKKQQNAPQKKQDKRPKDKPEPKCTKTKEIYKPSHHKKRPRNEERQQEAELKKVAVFSQRIIQKNQTKKEPYRLSKKERELLEISFLRELVNEIMTGPQFQARLPPFLPLTAPHALPAHSLTAWKKELRANLLERLEKIDE